MLVDRPTLRALYPARAKALIRINYMARDVMKLPVVKA